MTARQVFEGMLTELSKVNAPSLLLLDFNYFFNKAINQYINKRYNIYDVNLQTTDDIRVLKSTAILTPTKADLTTYSDVDKDASSYLSQAHNPIASLYGATYEIDLPKDYLHILNCICVYKVNKQFKCYDEGSYVQFAAKRLTSDSWSTIINDYYNRPLPERPYFYIHNVNNNEEVGALPTNLNIDKKDKYYVVSNKEGELGIDIEASKAAILNAAFKVSSLETNEDPKIIVTSGSFAKDKDINKIDWGATLKAKENSKYIIKTNNHSNFEREILIGNFKENVVERSEATRFGNPSNVRMEIRYGKDNTLFELKQVFVDYIKVPQYIRLTLELLDLTEDTSQIMEFPDYICQEIINELVHIVMENTADPRLLTHIPVSQSIANPAQALTQQQQAQAQALA